MKLKRRSADERKDRKAAVCMLAVVMIMLIVFPSFAENESGTDELQDTDDSVIMEEISAEGDEDAEGTDTESVQEETGEDPVVDEDDDTDGVEEIVQEEPENTTSQPERSVVLRASAGEKVSYTGKRVGTNAGETTVFSVTSGGTTYTGACAEQGVTMKTSGSATITRISNTSKIAKVVYYYAIALGAENWWTGSGRTDKVGKIIGMDHAGDTDVTKRRMVEVFCQIYNMGATGWYNTVTSSSGGGWSTNTAKKVRDYYNNINTSGISVPDGFEIWFAKTESGAQSFVMWAYNPAGYVTMKKASGNTSITG